MAMTDGLGVDVAIEAVGIPATFTTCTEIVRPGGIVANVGVHGKPVELPLQDLWIQDITITMGLVSTITTPMLLKLVAQQQARPRRGSPPTTSPSTSSWRPTTPSPAPPRRRPSRW